VICNVHHLHRYGYNLLYAVQPSRGVCSFEPLFSSLNVVCAPFPCSHRVRCHRRSRFWVTEHPAHGSSHKSDTSHWIFFPSTITAQEGRPHQKKKEKEKKKKKKSWHPSLWSNLARGLCPIWNLDRSQKEAFLYARKHFPIADWNYFRPLVVEGQSAPHFSHSGILRLSEPDNMVRQLRFYVDRGPLCLGWDGLALSPK
jgi:hypothetical protein